MVTKAGSTGVINLTKLVPVLGGVVSGTFDAVTTNIVGNAARNMFLDKDNRHFDGFTGTIYNEDGTKAQ